MILILQFMWALINEPISTYFNSKMGLDSTSYEFGLFSGLNSKINFIS